MKNQLLLFSSKMSAMVDKIFESLHDRHAFASAARVEAFLDDA